MNEKEDVYDCIIIGGGTAGLSAALVLGRARRKVLVCDKGNPRNAPAHESHSFFTRDGINPLELLTIGRQQLEPYKTVKFQAVAAQEITKRDELFEVTFADGKAIKSRKILFAFGVVDELPEIDNFKEFWGKSVFHCPFCHGYEVRDEPLAVLANAQTAVEMASLLQGWSKDLIICTDGAAEFSSDERNLLAKHRISVREEKVIRLEGANGQMEQIVFENGATLARRGLMYRPPQKLRSGLAVELGCELNDFNLLKVDDFNETTVKGVYAAGDITSPAQQIAAAASQGVVAAAVGVNRALVKEDFI